MEKEYKEKIELERDIIDIISNALRFTKNNNPMKAMICKEVNNKIQSYYDNVNYTENKNTNNRKSSNNNILNKSIGSLMNISLSSNISNNKYDSNAFLKSLGLDLSNLRPDNININIDFALKHINKWRLVDKFKIRNLIRMRVINEISSVEERRLSRRVKKINNKFKDIKNKDLECQRLNEDNNKTNSYLNDSNINKTSKTVKIVNNSKSKTIAKDNSKNKFLKSVLINNKSNKTTFKNNVNINSEIKDKESSYDISKNKYIIQKKNNYSNNKNQLKSTRKYRKVLLDSYDKADQILKMSLKSSKLKDNANLINHFTNLVNKKEADNIAAKALQKNKIIII